jgi:hypothetical protein
MLIRFVCLANSYKEGGRCLAGIVLDNANKQVKEFGRFKWIRPVCKTEHGEVYTNLVSGIKVLDIVQVEVTEFLNKGYQSENAYFKESSLKIDGRFSQDNLDSLCSNRMKIFESRGKAISQDRIRFVNYSLMFIKVSRFEVIEKTYDDSPDRTKTRLVFTYNGDQYDLPVTDPVFLHSYQSNPDFAEGFISLYLTLSLGVPWENWYYKLIAGIIPCNQPSTTPF